MAKIEVELTNCEYNFLVSLLANRKSLSTPAKLMILEELVNRMQSETAGVQNPH